MIDLEKLIKSIPAEESIVIISEKEIQEIQNSIDFTKAVKYGEGKKSSHELAPVSVSYGGKTFHFIALEKVK